jgi:hypothetical protein
MTTASRPPDDTPRLACNAPAPDRSGRHCDKPKAHADDHWTYGGHGLTWPRTIHAAPVAPDDTPTRQAYEALRQQYNAAVADVSRLQQENALLRRSLEVLSRDTVRGE